MRKMILTAALGAMLAPMAPALADPPPWAHAHGRRAHEAQYRHGDYRPAPVYYRETTNYRPRYDRYGRYATPQRLTANDRIWRGEDGRYYCRRKNGTTGLIVGAAAGALLGRAIDGGRDRTLGTILGAVGGGLLGRSIDRGDLRFR